MPWNVANMGLEGGLAAQLVLSYPEIYFLFFDSPKPFRSPGEFVDSYHLVFRDLLLHALELVQLHAQGFRTIFDATGLRSCLKVDLQKSVLDELNIQATVYGPFSAQRADCSAAIADEEVPFLYLNGYAAYKFGMRAWLAPTFKEFERLFQDKGARTPSRPTPAQFATAIVDWHLAYRDDTRADRSRDSLINELNAFRTQKVEQPLVVTSFLDQVRPTSGQQGTADDWSSRVITLPKPYGGLYQFVLEKPNRSNRFREHADRIWQEIRAKVRPWRSGQTTNVRKTAAEHPTERTKPAFTAHTAPYACVVVADRLLARGQRIRTDDPPEMESWVQIAVLACEVKEILGGLSRTTVYESLALQHEAEVHAELSFHGTSAQIEVKKRLEELRDEVQVIQCAGTTIQDTVRDAPCVVPDCPTALRWEKERGIQDRAPLNFLVKLTNKLRLQFAEHEEVNAAEHCLRALAKHQQDLECLRNPWLSSRFFRRLWLFLGWYPSLVTRAGTSVGMLFASSLLWIVGFTVIFAMLEFAFPAGNKQVTQAGEAATAPVDPLATSQQTIYREIEGGLSVAWWHSCLTFLTQPSLVIDQYDEYKDLKKSFPYRVTTVSELCVAYVHLGLLVAVLYRRVTKRAP